MNRLIEKTKLDYFSKEYIIKYGKNAKKLIKTTRDKNQTHKIYNFKINIILNYKKCNKDLIKQEK